MANPFRKRDDRTEAVLFGGTAVLALVMALLTGSVIWWLLVVVTAIRSGLAYRASRPSPPGAPTNAVAPERDT